MATVIGNANKVIERIKMIILIEPTPDMIKDIIFKEEKSPDIH